ncbi:MAG: hypothetical protein ACRDPC_04575, partial [Solirubrobacteraceae bacterium]
MPPRWSREEDRTLRRLYGQGAPLRVIAQRVGRSQDAVSERRRTLGIAARARMRPWSPVEDELLRAGTARGLSATEVARVFRIPPWVIGAPTGDSLTYANTTNQLEAFYKLSLVP